MKRWKVTVKTGENEDSVCVSAENAYMALWYFYGVACVSPRVTDYILVEEI